MEIIDIPEFTEKKPRRTLLIILSAFTFLTTLLRFLNAFVIFEGLNAREYVSAPLTERHKWLAVFALLIIASGILNSIGAILMLARKKTGFAIYSIGFLVSLASAFVLIFTAHDSMLKLLYFQIIIALAIVLPIAGIILYALALRKIVR